MVHIHSNFFTRMMNQGKTLSSVTICLNKLCSMLMQLVNSLTVLKTILLYVQFQEKRRPKYTFTDSTKTEQNFCFFKPQQIEAVEQLLSKCRAHEVETLDLETLFLKVLKTSQIYPIISKVRFVKGLANYINMSLTPSIGPSKRKV